MSVYRKGNQSREEIIYSSKNIFNESGIHITLSNLAQLLGTTLGRITHHFPNKDFLFIAIAREYENRLAEIRTRRTSEVLDFNVFINSVAVTMDLQYDFRCAIRYIVSSLGNQEEVKRHLVETYNNNRKSIYYVLKALADAGSLKDNILDEANYPVYLFKITNLMTTWVINLELYDTDKTYAEMKPVYIRGIMSSFIPYLTEKGLEELKKNKYFSTPNHFQIL